MSHVLQVALPLLVSAFFVLNVISAIPLTIVLPAIQLLSLRKLFKPYVNVYLHAQVVLRPGVLLRGDEGVRHPLRSADNI